MNLPITLEGEEPSQGQAEPTDASKMPLPMRLRSLAEQVKRFGSVANYSGSQHAMLYEAAAAIESTLAASSAAPTAALPGGWEPTSWVAYIAGVLESYLSSDNAAREADRREAAIAGIIGRRIHWLLPSHAAAQLAAVAAPPDAKATVENLRPLLDGWKGESRPGNQAAPGSLDASRAPLSEPCALDQGARPVRLARSMQLAQEFAVDYAGWCALGKRTRTAAEEREALEQKHTSYYALESYLRAALAPPVAQPGSTK